MQTLDIGNTSCTLACDVRSLQADRIVCSIDKMVYIRVNKYGMPKKHNQMNGEWNSKKEIDGEVVKAS